MKLVLVQITVSFVQKHHIKYNRFVFSNLKNDVYKLSYAKCFNTPGVSFFLNQHHILLHIPLFPMIYDVDAKLYIQAK